MAAKLESLGMHAGLIVSCQADPGSPLRSPSIMAAMARAAEMAGAVGIRANGALDIAAIKAEVRLPVIGINKIRGPGQHPRVYITPSFEAAEEVARVGCEILALHVLPQYDRDVAALKARMKRIKEELDVLLMADIATVEDARFAVDHGADIVATTSYRYAYVDEKVPGPPVELVARARPGGEGADHRRGKCQDAGRLRRGPSGGGLCRRRRHGHHRARQDRRGVRRRIVAGRRVPHSLGEAAACDHARRPGTRLGRRASRPGQIGGTELARGGSHGPQPSTEDRPVRRRDGAVLDRVRDGRSSRRARTGRPSSQGAPGGTSDVVFPRVAVSRDDAREVGRQFREQDVDLVVMFHATYVDDVMTLALLEAAQGIYPVLFLSQGMSGIPEGLSLIEAASCWGVNSAVQLPGSLRRLGGTFRCGFVFGHVG